MDFSDAERHSPVYSSSTARPHSSPVERLQASHPLLQDPIGQAWDEKMNGVENYPDEPEIQEGNGYAIQSIRPPNKLADAESIISFRAVLILASLASLKFHQLSVFSTTGGLKPRDRALCVGTADHGGSFTIVTLTLDQLELQPIETLINLIASQLQKLEPSTQLQNTPEAALLIDFSRSDDCPGATTKSRDDEELTRGAQFHLVLQVVDDRHLKLASRRNPSGKIHPNLANWFLLHTGNFLDQISKLLSTPDNGSPAQYTKAHTARLCSLPLKISEDERQIILKLSRPALTAAEINASRPPFVQHFLGSKSLVELVLRSAQINETLVALHWFERANSSSLSSAGPGRGDQNENLEINLTFKQFAHYSYLLSEHLLKILRELQPDEEPASENPTICLLMSKNPWLVLIMFAVSLTGSGYLNLELSTPKNRLKKILANSKVSLLLTFESYDNHQFNQNRYSQKDKTLREQLNFENILDLSTYCHDLQSRFGLCGKPTKDQTREFTTKRPLEILEMYESRMREMEERTPMAGGGKQIAYIVYTSGTTGEPKPIKISNSNLLHFLFNYALRFQRKNDGLTRVLQFASYAFDVSVISIWDTLAHGSTICMTSEENLKTDLIGTMISLRCTAVDLTPTVLNILLEDELFKSTENLTRARVAEQWAARGLYLNHLNTGAEPVSADLRRQFLSRGVSVCVDYGPSETTVGVISSLTLEYSPELPLDDIGRPTGLNEIYILEPHLDKLVPLGGVGEICVGGGQVAGGYADNGLTREKFVEVKLDGPEPIRVYRTGDLGKFLPSGSEGYGSICCLGRIDSQVKISGVRVELGEVEQRLNQLAIRLPSLHGHRLRTVISKWNGDNTRTAGLVCFVELNPQLCKSLRQQGISLTPPVVGSEAQVLSLSEHEEWFDSLVRDIKGAVRDDLSHCMIPRYWLPINRIPVNYAGKVDRRILTTFLEKHFCSKLPELPPAAAQGVGPLGRFEQIASEAWSVGLGNLGAASRFQDTDNFVKLGGDSIGMMRAIGIVRKNKIGVHFSTLARADNFLYFVKILQEHEPELSSVEPRASSYAPFDLLTRAEKETVLDHLAQVHSITADEVEDCYPTSPTQAGIISASLEDEYKHDEEKVGIYFSQAVYRINPSFSSESIARNMLQLVSNHPALRTIFVWPESLADIYQVVLDYSSARSAKNVEILRLAKEEDYCSELETYLNEDRDRRKFGWGRLSVSMRIFECEDSKQRRLVWSLHHALSDGWTLEILMRELGELCRREACQSSSIDVSPPRTEVRYSAFVEAWKTRSEVHQREIHQFWKVYLEGVQRNSAGSAFTTTQHKSTRWLGRQKLEELKLLHGITPAIAIRLSIAIGLFNSGLAGPDVVFGMVRSGREVDLDGGRLAEDVVGCCVSVLPIRTRLWDDRFRAMSLLEALAHEKEVEAEMGKHQMISIGELGRLVVGHGEWLDTLVTIQSWDSAEHQRPIKQPPELIRMPTRFKLSIEVSLEEDRDAVAIDLFYDNRSFGKSFPGSGRAGHSADALAGTLLADLVASLNLTLSDSYHHQPIQSILNPSLSTEPLCSTRGQLKDDYQSLTNSKTLADEQQIQSADGNQISHDQETRKVAKMREIWMDILGLTTHNPPGFNQSFENLGGDSISMMRLIKRIKDEFYQDADPESTRASIDAITPCCTQDGSHPTATQSKIRTLFREIKNGIKFIDLVHLV
ncbi:hypothetical protein PtA15_16A60 [Puccinia triticina]|uniref:Carrier domain-containing protein n=1 Tax=Puccinia triticina TaxID=208348 RepID=A0ABY7D5U2_9BASI|nr:uncharacterized protein PtA15_16A60 [Puccinia triticina]WAQ92154.1 hypothetical protein PtA15_16A60 [Puccinia triticina]